MVEELFEKAIGRVIDSGYAVCDYFIEDKLVKGLRHNLKTLFNNDDLKLAGIGKWDHFQKDRSIRNDRIHWISDQSENTFEKEFLRLVDQFVNYLNSTCFTGIKTYEFHYALYQKGAFYKKHIDQFTNDIGRKYTMIFYLNEDWKGGDGGELVLYFANSEVKILPVAGRLVFFESHKIEHEVKPAKRERMSVTGWLKNTETKLKL